MRNLVSSALFVLFAFLAVFSTKKASASHAAGAEIIYVHIADSTYQFFFKFYRDCSGIGEPASATLCFFNTCTNQTFTVPMQKWQGTLPPDNRPNGSPVSAGCSQFPNKCTNSSSNLPGYREWWYSCIATLPLKCNYWKFATWINARNGQTNIVPGTMYVETTFNSSFDWDNSSPYYSVKPIPYVCLNQQFSYNNGALDADGDSLYSIMINPLNHGACNTTPTAAPLVNLTPAINFNNNPLQTNNTFNLNSFNGQMTFTASLQGAATITMKTTEYYNRPNGGSNNGREVGSIMRDVQVQVLPCSTIPPTLDTVSVGGSGDFQNGKVYGCVGEKLDFCFNVTSPDTGAILLAEDDLATSIPGAVINYTNLRTDSISGCFDWTPTVNDVGAHQFFVIIKDSTCKPPGILLQYVRTVDVVIWGPVEASPDTSICIGESAFLGVTGGQDYQWTVLSGTNPSLSNPGIANPVATPQITTVYKVESTINPYCPKFNKDTVEITVLKGPDITGQNDTLTCPGHPVQLNVGIVNKDPNLVYTTTWVPSTGLSNPLSDITTATLKTPTTYYVSVGSSSNRCTTRDTINVDVLTGFTIENPDTAICEGQGVTIRGTGDSRYNYDWRPADASNGVTFTVKNDIETDIIPSRIGKDKYVLYAQYGGCPDSTAEIEIDLQPIPSITVNEDETMCYGDTMQLNAIVTPAYANYSYEWTPGEALDFPEEPDPIFSAITEGVTTIKAVVTTPAGCTDDDDVELNVVAAEFIFVPQDTAICPGESITLNTTVDEGVKFYWAPDFNISSVSSLSPVVNPVADQTYYVYGVDSLGCLDTADVFVKVHARAVIDMPDSVTIYPGESFRMDPGGNCLYYSWFPPVGLSNADVSNPMVSPDVHTRYVVNGRTEAGCSVTDSIDIYVKNDNMLEVPNAFTPGRRANGTLKVISRGIAELKLFTVYNRWGQKVFESTDINEGWDGTFNSENQPTGVYIYTVEAVTPSGRSVNKQGNVTLIR